MIECLVRHDTEMRVDKNFVDLHGQSEVAFAFVMLGSVRLSVRGASLQRRTLTQAVHVLSAGFNRSTAFYCLITRSMMYLWLLVPL
jgi:TnpA family transposase